MLLAYLNTPAAQQHYDGAILPFLTLHKELQAAKESLEKFRAACNKSGADRPTLPASLKLSISERARLPTVEGQPDLFKDEQKELQSIETDATKRTIDVLLKAKEKHIAALQSKANAQNFKEKATSSYMEFLTPHARQFDELQGVDPAPSLSQAAAASSSAAPASSSSLPLRFPVDEARLHFQKHITSRVDSTVFELLAKQKERLERKKRQHEESVAAKERILQGASSGETLTALANKAAKQAIAPLQRDVHRLTEQSKRQKLHNTSAAAPSSASQSERQPRIARSNQHAPTPHASRNTSATPAPSSARTAPRIRGPVPAATHATPHTAAHTTQHAAAQRKRNGGKRKQQEDAEQGNKRGRNEKHHPDAPTQSLPRSGTPAAATARDFHQGGPKRRQQEGAELNSKKGRDEKHHSDTRTRPPPRSAAPASAVPRDFPQGGDRHRRRPQRTQHPRGANSERLQKDNDRRGEASEARE